MSSSEIPHIMACSFPGRRCVYEAPGDRKMRIVWKVKSATSENGTEENKLRMSKMRPTAGCGTDDFLSRIPFGIKTKWSSFPWYAYPSIKELSKSGFAQKRGGKKQKQKQGENTESRCWFEELTRIFEGDNWILSLKIQLVQKIRIMSAVVSRGKCGYHGALTTHTHIKNHTLQPTALNPSPFIAFFWNHWLSRRDLSWRPPGEGERVQAISKAIVGLCARVYIDLDLGVC